MILSCTLNYKATVVKKYHTDIKIDTVINEIKLKTQPSPHTYEHLIFAEARNAHFKKDSILKNWVTVYRKIQIDPYLQSCTKLTSIWLKHETSCTEPDISWETA